MLRMGSKRTHHPPLLATTALASKAESDVCRAMALRRDVLRLGVFHGVVFPCADGAIERGFLADGILLLVEELPAGAINVDVPLGSVVPIGCTVPFSALQPICRASSGCSSRLSGASWRWCDPLSLSSATALQLALLLQKEGYNRIPWERR